LTPDQIYQQCIDKQRVVVTGNGSLFISLLIHHVLKHYNRKFDYVVEGQEPVIHKDSPTIIIQSSLQLLDYKHHIGILSDITSGVDAKPYEQFADATPKGGTLIYQEGDPIVKTIGAKERADIQTIPFKRYQHEVQNGKTILISSTNEKIPIKLSGDPHLQYISASKEILKKLGITSGQFYRAVGDFQFN
jgi:UDP-N-acetylmuramate: L-alanyl-gamma-D-glutamyl-meso-diaminopimelate ligase